MAKLRCEECKRFRKGEEGDAEVTVNDLSDGILSVTVEIPINCEECSTQLATKRFDTDIAIPKNAEVEV